MPDAGASQPANTRARSFSMYRSRWRGERPWPEFPMPGDEGRDRGSFGAGDSLGFTVVASVVYDEEYTSATVLLLYEGPPFFGVAIVNTLTGGLQYHERFMNIVPAVDAYKDSGGDY